MKLLYICSAFAVHGGLERVVIEKANWFVVHAGYKVCLLTANQGTHPLSYPLHQDVSYEDLNIRFNQQYKYSGLKRIIVDFHLHKIFRERLSQKLEEFQPDVVICTGVDFIRDVVRVKGSVPCVFESHSSRKSYVFEGSRKFRRLHVWYLQRAVKKVQMVVALTIGDANEWRKLTSKVCIIPNVVHLNDTGLMSDCTSKSIIFVGRLTMQKGINDLLHIWEQVSQRYPDWQLHVYAGYSVQQKEMLSKINQNNAQIIVHEPIPQINEAYMKSSMLLSTSVFEPFGLVIPEAMSFGLPVVAFDCPYGPAEIINDGVDGFLIRNRSIKDFVDKVCLLIEDKQLRQRMGQKGVHSSQRYEANQVMPQWKQLFEQLLEITIK